MNWLDAFGGLKRLKNRETPMYAQLVHMIRQAVESGQFASGMQLPTSRELASLLEIDRSTVSRSYLELERAGLVESHVGRGTFIRLSNGGAHKAQGENGGRPMLWSEKFSRASQTAVGIFSRQLPQLQMSGSISFSGGVPTEEFYPYDEFENIVGRLAKSNRASQMFEYSPAEGHAGLRAEVLKYLRGQGISATDDELLIVSGSQQGIDIVTRTLVDPGDAVLIEEPTYFWAMCNFSAGQARCLPVPLDQQGVQLDILESILGRCRPKLFYLMPSFQNPTGSTLSLKRRRQLLEMARRHQVPILEDNFLGDLRYDGENLPSLKALDTGRDTVIHQGTFSKALCPGLRLGWIVAPVEVMARLRLAKRTCDLSTNTMAQAVMAEYLRAGHYQRHLQTVQAAYRCRRDAMCAALQKHLPSGISWSKPEGGFFIWARLPAGCSAREFSRYAEREGVYFSPGDMFFLNGDRGEFFRLTFVQMNEASIDEGIARLGKAAYAYLSNIGRSTHRGNRSTEAAMI